MQKHGTKDSGLQDAQEQSRMPLVPAQRGCLQWETPVFVTLHKSTHSQEGTSGTDLGCTCLHTHTVGRAPWALIWGAHVYTWLHRAPGALILWLQITFN